MKEYLRPISSLYLCNSTLKIFCHKLWFWLSKKKQENTYPQDKMIAWHQTQILLSYLSSAVLKCKLTHLIDHIYQKTKDWYKIIDLIHKFSNLFWLIHVLLNMCNVSTKSIQYKTNNSKQKHFDVQLLATFLLASQILFLMFVQGFGCRSKRNCVKWVIFLNQFDPCNGYFESIKVLRNLFRVIT